MVMYLVMQKGEGGNRRTGRDCSGIGSWTWGLRLCWRRPAACAHSEGCAGEDGGGGRCWERCGAGEGPRRDETDGDWEKGPGGDCSPGRGAWGGAVLQVYEELCLSGRRHWEGVFGRSLAGGAGVRQTAGHVEVLGADSGSRAWSLPVKRLYGSFVWGRDVGAGRSVEGGVGGFGGGCLRGMLHIRWRGRVGGG